MRRDPKKISTYRFNGSPFLRSGSIHSVSIAELETRIRAFEAKLADPEDPDDKKWTERWLNRYRAELSKKLEGRSLKAEEKAKAVSRRCEHRESEPPDA
jgi:hypothetical protein